MKRFVVSFLILSFFIWLGVVLSLYFKVHYSYLALFLSKNNILDELYFLFLLALLSYALGRRIFLLCRFKFYSLSEEFIFASGLGWVILAYLTGLVVWKYVYILIMSISLLLIKDLLLIVRIIIDKIRFVFALKFTVFEGILGLLLGVTVFLTLLRALSPPFELGELTYLQSAHLYIQTHNPFNFLSTIELLFSLGIILNSAILAKLIHLYFGLLIIIGIFALMNRHFNFIAGLLASCIFYISNVVIFLASTARIELGITFYELLVVYALLCWVSSYKISWFVIMIIQIGFTLASNYSGRYTQIGLELFSPIYLLCLPLVIFIIKEKLITKYLFSYIVIQLLIWCWIKIDLLPLLPLLAILISHLIYNHLKEYTLLRRVVFGVITGIFILILSSESYVIFNYHRPLKFIFGLETSADYIARNQYNY